LLPEPVKVKLPDKEAFGENKVEPSKVNVDRLLNADVPLP